MDIDRLTSYLKAELSDIRPPLRVERCAGGQSNPTYKITDAQGQTFALRRKPEGPTLKSAHAVDREFRVISALHGSNVPVAKPHILCTDEGVIGSMFYLMEFVEGRIFWKAGLGELPRAERPAIYDAMNQTIADLHSFDFAGAGLGDYGKAGNYFERQISRWSRQYNEDEAAGRFEAMDRLIEWLPKNIPDDRSVSLVHGDFRLDNLIFDAREPRILAIIDWELSTIGHPLADFAYNCLIWRFPAKSFGGLKEEDLQALNIPTEEAHIRAYCQRTGRDHIASFDFYIAFNLFRFAGILHGIAGRIKRGNAAGKGAERRAALTGPMAEAGWEAAKRCNE